MGQRMRVNIFEGARRISKLVMGVIVAGSLVAIWTAEPYLNMRYQVRGPSFPLVKVDECGEDDAREYINRRSADGKTIHITICFMAHPAAKTGEMLIPYMAMEDGKWWMNEKYSAAVSAYTKSVANAFAFSAEDAKQADSLWTSTRIKDGLQGLGFLIIALVAFLIFTKIIGWIVRGFLGIPSGQDMRPQ